MRIADVLLPQNGGRVFSYLCEDPGLTGRYVYVPLGNRKKCLGIVISEPREIDGGDSIEYRPIAEVPDYPFRLTPARLELANFVAEHFFCSVSEAISLILPEDPSAYKDPPQFLTVASQEAADAVRPRERAKRRVVDYLLKNGPTERLALQAAASVPRSVLLSMIDAGVLTEIGEPTGASVVRELTREQREVLDQIERIGGDVLLHGVTGSGKTEIYLALIDRALAEGKRAMFLVPEISLTPQMTSRIRSRFRSKRVAVVHSKVSPLERNTVHRDIALGKYDIVLGARSAVFAPLEDIGVIIVDECHERSFRSEKRPRYDAAEVASFLASRSGALLVRGSATPNVDEYYRYREAGRLVTLAGRYNDYEIPRPTIVDMRHETDKIISSGLHLAIEERLAKGEQTILFLNKKGFSSVVICRDCGFMYRCPNCDIAMTYYREQSRLECGYCGYREQEAKTCPSCGSASFGHFGLGTERIEEEIRIRYPRARVARLDRSVVTSGSRLETILNDMESGDVDILIGTQIVAKGLDFSRVTLIGILAADIQLRLPSYLASERAFQIFTQVSGRAGRSGLRSEVILQTFAPEHYAIRHQDYESFYAEELAFREKLGYPPYRTLYLLTFADESEERARVSAERSRSYLVRYAEHKSLQNQAKILHVLPAFLKKQAGRYRYQVLISLDAPAETLMKEAIGRLESKLSKTKLSSITIDIGAKN